MKLYVDRFERYLGRPMDLRARLPTALLVIPLVAAIFLPLWQISMTAPRGAIVRSSGASAGSPAYAVLMS